ncbi:MAG: hypothetical protein Q9222_005253 [Ikaeria aurantiellina]
MRRFDTDRIGAYFSPQRRAVPLLPGPAYHPPLRRDQQHSHIQIIPNAADPPGQYKTVSPAVTFRRPSYSEEVEQTMAAAASSSLPPKAPASLANMTLGTTFAAKARQAELNAARARKGEELNENEEMPSRNVETLGAITLSKPRNKGKGWKPLNLDEIPEITSEPNHHDPDQPLTAVKTTFTSNGPNSRGLAHYPQHPHQVAQQGTEQQYRPQLVPIHHFTQANQPHLMNPYVHNTYMSPEQLTYQMHQLNYLASQRTAQLQSRPVAEDPFVDLPASSQQPLHGLKPQTQDELDRSNYSGRSSPSVAHGMMDSDFKFPLDQQQQQYDISQRPAAVATTHQRDPRPYTSFVPSTNNGLHKGKHQQKIQHTVDHDSSLTRQGLQSSTRTVLYDPITRHIPNHPAKIGLTNSQISSVYIPPSDPLYNARSHASLLSHLPSTEQSAALTVGSMDQEGDTPSGSYTSEAQTSKHRQEETEKWWKYDGRGQEELRAYLEQIVDQHSSNRVERDYRNSKKILERQANFRDDRSDNSNSTGASEASGEVSSRVLIPVIANLRHYTEDTGYFNKFTPAPVWAVDSGADGNRSFFGEDWGKRPSRVGRDPRYRPTFHEGRYTVFEPNDGRVSGRGW